MSVFSSIKSAISIIRGKSKDAACITAKATVAVAEKAQEVSADVLDTITRKSTDDAVREYMLVQSRYNDILALKLEEALKRIEALERREGKK